MKKEFIRRSFGVSLAVILLSIPAYSVLANDSNEILLRSRRFIPEQGITDAAKAAIEAIPERAHVIIQFERIPTNEERKGLEAEGIKLLSYIPNKAWLASISSDKTSEIAALSSVRTICEFLPEDKISPHIIAGELVEQRIKDGKTDFIVEFFKDVSFAEIDEVIQRHNGLIVGRVPSLNAVVAVLQVEEGIALCFEESVKWLEQELPLGPLNDGSRAAINVDAVQAPPYNLNGNNISVLVYDEGLVDKTHSDFGDRVIWGEGGPVIDHSTHVAGTLGGDGTGSEPNGGTPLQWKGMAHAVDIISYGCIFSCPDPCICLYNDSASMADMENNFNDGIANYGVDIGTASVAFQPGYWAWLGYDYCHYEGDYRPHAQLVDTIIYKRAIPITWAAGNENGWFFSGCVKPYYTICPTATGKNAIIVGAINSNDDSMYWASSWGPTDDGRVKPDVVAPGFMPSGLFPGLSYVRTALYIASTWRGGGYLTCGSFPRPENLILRIGNIFCRAHKISLFWKSISCALFARIF
jgi:hypothetical protein